MTPATARGGAPRALRALAFRVYYALPLNWRRRLVRLGIAMYALGSVVLVRQAGAEPPGYLLMVRQPPGKGWSLPAGLLQRGERPISAAARELAEETGVELAESQLSPAVPNAVVHTSGRWVDMVFTAEAPADVPLVPDGLEILEVAWQPIDALPPVTPATARLLGNYGLGPYAEYPETRT